MTIATKIKQLRERNGWSQCELGRHAGLAASAISQFEGGQREPSLESLCRLADALSVTTDELLGRDDERPIWQSLRALHDRVSALESAAVPAQTIVEHGPGTGVVCRERRPAGWPCGCECTDAACDCCIDCDKTTSRCTH